MENFIDNQRCFVCGGQNPFGLKLNFKLTPENSQAETEVSFPDHFQGWADVVHGGLVSTVLDEVMVKAATAKNISCVTAEMTVKFRKPIQPNTVYRVRGKIVEDRERVLLANAALRDDNGLVFARASAKLFVIS